MRVIHVITRLVIGGAQENTVSTVLGLREKPDVEVSLISGPTRGPEGSMEPGFADMPGLLTIVPSLVRPVHPWNDIRALQQLTRLFRERRPDIVHTHSGKAGLVGRLAARHAEVRVVVHHIHGPSFGPFQGWLPNICFSAAERLAGRYTTHFVCSAEAMSRRYLKAGIGEQKMYTRVFSGFRLEPFLAAGNDVALRAGLGFSERDFVIGKIARLAPLKGHEDLLRAFKEVVQKCERAKLLFVGDGQLKQQLEATACSLGVANKVKFVGLVLPGEVARYVGIMDCLCHLSSREALSRALPQALAAAKPVIAYDFDGADEICFQGETGFLVRAGDIDSVTSHLLKLAADAPLRQRLGQSGQEFVRANFSVGQMVDKQYQLYRRLLAPAKIIA